MCDTIHETIYIILYVAPSGPPTNVTAEAVSATELNISWQPPLWLEQNGIITAFKVVIVCPDLNINYTYNTTGNTTVLTATGYHR